jgi:deoxycytidine triphosphate deaminase
MPKFLPDSEIRKLLGTVILDGSEERLNPNGIEVRLGTHVLFHSTDEEMELGLGKFLKVHPGESVTISSLECFDFRRETVHEIFQGHDLMAFITPTTTMMRECILQAATKVDPGFHGVLNWGLRNSSSKDFILGYGEPIVKLTILLLEEGEIPEAIYGDRQNDKYQDSHGIVRSTRTIPANISKKNVIESSLARLDPAKALREAGHPFDHISTELTDLHGKFVVVSNEVAVLKETISTEGNKLSEKVDTSQRTILEKVENLFDRKFLTTAGAIVGCIAIMFGIITFLQTQGITGITLGIIAVAGGFAVVLVAYLLAHRPHSID